MSYKLWNKHDEESVKEAKRLGIWDNDKKEIMKGKEAVLAAYSKGVEDGYDSGYSAGSESGYFIALNEYGVDAS